MQAIANYKEYNNSIYPARFAEQPITLWLSIAIGAISVIGLLVNPLWTYAPPARDD